MTQNWTPNAQSQIRLNFTDMLLTETLYTQIATSLISLLVGAISTYFFLRKPQDKNGRMYFGPNHWNEEETSNQIESFCMPVDERDFLKF